MNANIGHDDAETPIRALIAEQLSALCVADVEKLMELYAEDVVVFDMKPPFQIRGRGDLRRMWEMCLPLVPTGLIPAVSNLRVTVSGAAAIAHFLWRLDGHRREDPQPEDWIRTTAGYQRNDGRWKIIHEHVSVPLDPDTFRAIFAAEPEPAAS